VRQFTIDNVTFRYIIYMETKSEVLEVPMRRIQKSIGALLQGFF
jgi:hypothetical protein